MTTEQKHVPVRMLGKAARLNFSRRTRQARCRYSNSMTVHTFP